MCNICIPKNVPIELRFVKFWITFITVIFKLHLYPFQLFFSTSYYFRKYFVLSGVLRIKFGMFFTYQRQWILLLPLISDNSLLCFSMLFSRSGNNRQYSIPPTPPCVIQTCSNKSLFLFTDKELLNGLLYVDIQNGKGFHRSGKYFLKSWGGIEYKYSSTFWCFFCIIIEHCQGNEK